jgi:hypothetical protein
MEIRIFPNESGGIGGEAIRLRTGTASQGQVDSALRQVAENPELRRTLINNSRSAMDTMNSGGNWGNSVNRGAEMKFLIDALERMR